ncbi:hypothetical protein [Microbulbifer taiwanensis]|uniref:Tse2 ADP-ribosyltransferase toxin domain-containing protein n=1 Tax=Microbulbifer taiwanensis TaxID=986746 RepID=A0ABW1YNV4_9GAMM|nr:hypothetical protein [Microbulbifer taiwanensis]
MLVNKEFYIVPEEVFRVGNGSGPRMHMVRPSEVDVTEVNGVKVIIANGRGVSLYTQDELNATTLTGWIWKFKAQTQIPQGLKLVNDKPGHFCVAPVSNMPVDLYKGLLEQMGMKAEKVWKKTA